MTSRLASDRLQTLLVPSEARPATELDLGYSVLISLPEHPDSLNRYFQSNPAAHFLMQLRSPASRRTQAAQLRRLARYLGARDWHEVDWPGLGYGGCNAVFARLGADQPSAATYNAARAAVRGVMRQAFLLGQIDHEAWLRIQAIPGDRQAVRKTPAGRFLPDVEVKEIFQNCEDGSVLGLRDAAIIATLFHAGLRRSEAADLDINDIQLGESLDVRSGKGRKFRRIPMIPQLTARLESWYLARGAGPGAYFRRISRKDRVLDAGISSQTAYNVLKRRAQSISCSPMTLGAHLSRASWPPRMISAPHVALPAMKAQRPPSATIGVKNWPTERLWSN